MEYKVIFVTFLVSLSCAKAQLRDKTILTILEEEGLTTFASWCREERGIYDGQFPVTVFVFNDTVYNTMPLQDRGVLQGLDSFGRSDYVKSYTLLSKYLISQLHETEQGLESINGRRLYASKEALYTDMTTGRTRTFINGAMIVREDIQASNGVIHVLDRVLGPISTKKVYDYINRPDDSSVRAHQMMTLFERIYERHFGLVVAPLSYEKKITFFLPSDQALDRIPGGKLLTLSGENLAEYLQMHYITRHVIFTNVVHNNRHYPSGAGSQVYFKKSGERVSVSSGGVTAQIIRGNITVENGVIHIIDRMLGFIYNTAIEQIGEDCPTFTNLLERASPQTRQLIQQRNGINMFIPTEEAFNYIRNLPGANYETNQTLLEKIILLGIIKDGALEVTQMGDGDYAARQRRISFWNDMKLTIYNERNDTWVNGGNVRARIIRPDVGVKKDGNLQYIDRVLGIPSMDIPTLIYYDDYLLRTYYEMQKTRLDEYLRDPQFDSSALPARTFDMSGLPSNNYGQQNNYYLYTTQFPDQYPTQVPSQVTRYPNNIPESEYQRRLQQQQSGQQYPGQGSQYPNQGSQYPNQGSQYPNQGSQYPNQGSQYPNQGSQYPNQGSQYPNQGSQYPNQGSQYPNQGSQFQGNQPMWCDNRCSYGIWGCRFTFFVPNGTAIEHFYMSAFYAQTVIRDVCRLRFVLRRHIVPHQVIELENMQTGGREKRYQTDTGEDLIIRKDADNDVRILWKGQSSRVIMWDLGATNGIVHIIDQVLSDSEDQRIDISGASYIVSNVALFMSMLLLSIRYILH